MTDLDARQRDLLDARQRDLLDARQRDLLDARQRNLKEQFIEHRGYWSPLWQQVLELSPDFFEAYTAFSSVPWRHGPLEPKVKEFVYVAVNIATTHLYVTGARTHVRNAIGFGASREELMEVMQLACQVGIHAMAEGVPMLFEEAGEPLPAANGEADPIRTGFEASGGYWNPAWDGFAGASPEFARAFAELAAVPWRAGALSPKVKALLLFAMDAATTALHRPGMRLHLREALRLGATREELMEVLMLVSAIGIHTCGEGVPMLMEEWAAAGGESGGE